MTTANISKHHETLVLMDMIERTPSTGTVFDAIKHAIEDHKPMGSILQTLREMYTEAPEDTVKVFGEEIVNQLKKCI